MSTRQNRATPPSLALLDLKRPLTEREAGTLAKSCLATLSMYRKAVDTGKPSRALTTAARRALLHLGGDPQHVSASLKHYDHNRYGPFLGVSDEGSAAGAIREAGLASPKVKALPASVPASPLVVGLAVDAERLSGVGEVAVGPEEYADVWLGCVGRVLMTTNVGTRVNVRAYRREPRVLLRGADAESIARAKEEITATFAPFVATPDKKPRPLTVFVDIPRYVEMAAPQKQAALSELATFVASGKAANTPRAPEGHLLGLAVWVRYGPAGREESKTAIDLAAAAGMSVVLLDGVKRKAADAAISLAGLLDYFAPGIVSQLLRYAAQKKVRLRAANLSDTDTIARGIWVGLATARNMGINLGKYGCFPLTRAEIDRVVEQVQGWMATWSAAPVFFVDQGLMDETQVDVERDLPRGIERWLDTVAAHGVRVVLIDTMDKGTGRHLLKGSKDKKGFLGLRQIERIEQHAKLRKIKVLWAGGLQLRDAYAMGRLGVFGIYVTSAAATTIAVDGSYIREPVLASLKEPTQDAVLRTKVLVEAGFLASRLGGDTARELERAAEGLLASIDVRDTSAIAKNTETLASLCIPAWRLHWKQTPASRVTS
ncbi:MAG: hypothetical protein DMF86_12385 [Acidobacteria bacterium]|nr:MAG: hypothetical protein DMF86_12385 [Acidobacteriota bacterium]